MFFITIFILIFSLFIPLEVVVKADDSVNNSVFDYYDKQNSDVNNENENNEKNQLEEEDANPEQEPNPTVGVTFMDIVRTILVLVIVIGLLLAVLKWLQKKSNLPYSGNLVKNLGGTPLGGNRSIQIIQAGNSILIVGVGEDVQLLKEVTDENEISELLEQYNERMNQQVITKNFFVKTKGFLEKKMTGNQSETQHTFKKEIEKRIKELETKRKEAMEEHLKKGSKEE